MVHYVGLDVSLKQTSICVVDQAGSVVREGVVDSDPEAITAFVRSKAPGALRIGLETGPTTTWLRTELKRLGLPVIYWDRAFADAGGLISYGSSVTEMFHQVGSYAGRILKGEKPADMPVMRATKFELVINLKAAKTLGLTVPAALLAIADEVIE
jgi:hypothetical protein